MEPVLVSVVIPFYNTDQKLFDRCIRSVIDQKYKNIECVVVDDGSDEAHAGILQGYTDIDSRVSIFRKENGGLGNTRNYGAAKASGEYVFFLDSDDYISPYAVQNGVDIALKNDADVVIGGLLHIASNEKCEFQSEERNVIVLKERKDMADLVGHISGYRDNRFILENCSVGPSACAKLVRRSLLLKVPFVNDKYWDEDNLWCISLFDACSCVAIADINWYCYVINPQSMIRKYAGDRGVEFQTRAKQEHALIMDKWPGCEQAAYLNIFHGLMTYMRTDAANPNNPNSEDERYSGFCKAIAFDEFNSMVEDINFDFEHRFIHKTVKKLIVNSLKKQNKRSAFDLLCLCVRKLKF